MSHRELPMPIIIS